ncbi:MAG: hypothetical protein AB2L24_23710 [Mangrovibacterium sp.]
MNTELKKILETSLDKIKAGHFLKIEEFVIGGLKNGRLQVNSYLPYNTINEIPKESIASELQRVKKEFLLLINQSQVFKEYALNAGIDYHLVLDTGNAGISVCTEIDGMYRVFL